MISSASLWAALVLATAVNTSAVAGDVTNQATSDDTQPSIETGQITSVLRSLAGALSSGSEAMRHFTVYGVKTKTIKMISTRQFQAWNATLIVFSAMSLVIAPRSALKKKLILCSD